VSRKKSPPIAPRSSTPKQRLRRKKLFTKGEFESNINPYMHDSSRRPHAKVRTKRRFCKSADFSVSQFSLAQIHAPPAASQAALSVPTESAPRPHSSPGYHKTDVNSSMSNPPTPCQSPLPRSKVRRARPTLSIGDTSRPSTPSTPSSRKKYNLSSPFGTNADVFKSKSPTKKADPKVERYNKMRSGQSMARFTKGESGIVRRDYLQRESSSSNKN